MKEASDIFAHHFTVLLKPHYIPYSILSCLSKPSLVRTWAPSSSVQLHSLPHLPVLLCSSPASLYNMFCVARTIPFLGSSLILAPQSHSTALSNSKRVTSYCCLHLGQVIAIFYFRKPCCYRISLSFHLSFSLQLSSFEETDSLGSLMNSSSFRIHTLGDSFLTPLSW